MNEPLVEVGEKVHVITRRNFAEDLRRHFAGTVRKVVGDLIRVEGYTFVFNSLNLEYNRRPEVRTRVFGPGDPGFIVNIIPRTLEIADLRYMTIDGRLYFTDGAKFRLDINEYGTSY